MYTYCIVVYIVHGIPICMYPAVTLYVSVFTRQVKRVPFYWLCMKVLLKMPKWPGISEMSNVLHTLANWELPVQ